MALKRPPAGGPDDQGQPLRPFDVRIIKTLVGLMAQNDLSEIDLHEGEFRIRLRRGTKQEIAQTVTAPAAAAPAPAPATHAPPPTATPLATEPKPAAPAKAGQTIKSPTP